MNHGFARDMPTCSTTSSVKPTLIDQSANISSHTDSTQLNYQYNYGNTYGSFDDPQHRQLHRIWETDPYGELLINRRSDVSTTTTTNDALTTSTTGTLRYIFMDIYLPNGLLLPIQCPAHRTLALLKQDVFIQARKYPLSSRLLDISNYIFATIGFDGTHVELYDEQKTVSSLQFLFIPLLVLVEPEGNKTEKELNQNIGIVMGITLAELERSLDEELHQYRLGLFETCLFAESQRGTQSFCHYAFPEEPLLHQEPAQLMQKLYDTDEIGETDLDYAQFPEQPGEIEKRAMEKLRQKMQFSDAYIEIWYSDSEPILTYECIEDVEMEQFKYVVRIGNVLGMTTEDVIQATLRELTTKYNLENFQQSNDFIFQIVGRRVFITRRDVLLTQFNYIRSCFENYRIPRLILRWKKHVFVNYPAPPKIFEPSYMRRERHNQYLKNDATLLPSAGEQVKPIKNNTILNQSHSSDSRSKTRFLWDLDENLRVRILSASNIILQDNADHIFIRVAVSVGRHVLNLKDSSAVSPSNPRWQEGNIDFDVYMKDLPESAQLCFFLISIHHSSSISNEYNLAKKGTSERQRGNIKLKADQLYPLGWANLCIFNWQNRLLQGKQTLFLRPFTKDKMKITYPFKNGQFVPIDESNYFGDVSSTITKSRTARLEIEMPEYFGHSIFIEYPSDSVIQRYVTWLKSQQSRQHESESAAEIELDIEYDEYSSGKNAPKLMPGNPDLERLLRLRRCLDSTQLEEDDQKFLWALRHKIQCLFPQMLPVLADCVLIWREREKMSEFYHLLAEWPPLQVDTAIELLDGRYVDRRLRRMAIQHLNNALNNDQLQLYLLVLVQAIRFEPHAYSPLAQMLLTRALMDYRVGHTLFWLLRAELAHLLTVNQNHSINNSTGYPFPSLFFRFAFLLEAYCRGNNSHLQSMIKQVEMISILVTLSSCICASGNKDTANKKLQQELLLRKGQMQHMVSPVNATDQLGELLIDECRVLGSAKQPLLLTWRNPESLAELTTPTHQLIFKCGDDMRQDMLTLHVMRIMDAKWKSQLQQDYCMTLYEVLPMGKNIGLIHVVPDCQTLFQIQCEAKRTATMDLTLLNKYIYKKCCGGDSKKYLECVDRFTYSLAGYCVATYILGIKDRHQDNIMLAKDGRIFHIDFGHFLGHTKRKLGINRELTDFVLTDHFLYVISRGKSNFRQTYEYTSFREECIKGFLVLHNQARFFIALFRMMSCMGLPELSSADNIDFLRQSLMYDKVERADARMAFEQIFEDVVKGDWSVHLNWFFHSVRHM